MSEGILMPEGSKRQAGQTGIEADNEYALQEDGSYTCKTCGSVIMAAKVAHPVWDGPFPMSGSGKCIYEEVPYCPKCEKRPECSGSLVTPKGGFHNP